MKLQKEIEPFRATIEAIQRLLAKFDNRGVIIGGIAVGFLGRPRLTEDVDAMFLLSTQQFAHKNRVLLLQHAPTETNVDISLGVLPFEEEMVERRIVQSTSTLSIRLPTPEDLIIMKAVAHRPKDLEDIRTIIDKNPKLDVDRIRQWTKSFADVLETPGLWTDIEDMFK